MVAEVTLDAVREPLLRLTSWAEFCRRFAADKKMWVFVGGSGDPPLHWILESQNPPVANSATRMGHPVGEKWLRKG